MFKVGDKVYVNWGDSENVWRGVGIIKSYSGRYKIYSVMVNNKLGGFRLEELIPIEVYNSPLFKLMQEIEEND